MLIKMNLTVTVMLAACFYLGNAYKILAIFPLPAKSHSILGDGVVRHLAAAGHDVTYITPFPKKTPPKNVRQVDVSDNFYHFPTDVLNITLLMNKKMDLEANAMFKIMLNVHNTTYNNPNVQKILLDTNEQFDVVIAEWMFSELYSGFAGIFNAPLIWMSTVEPHWMVLRLIDEACSPAYTSDSFGSSSPPYTFVQRALGLGSQIFVFILKMLYIDPFNRNVYSSLTPYFKIRGREPPSFDELAFNASLMFGNSHVSLGQATSLPQSYKAIGGYHINTNVEPLPEDLQKLLDKAENGVILFSMGSNVKSKDLPTKLKKSLFKMFGELKQTVIWKFEESLPEAPSNVRIVQWAPQLSILAHHNCILFITHGGLLSITEAIHFGKPTIGIPVFGDQFNNVDRSVAKGFAKRVDLSVDMADDLKAAINEIIQDPKYTNKAKELSFIYHDRPVSPGAELVHWTEHVIKTKGAPHLRSPALDVDFYQKMYLDLLALIGSILIVISLFIKRIFKKKSSQKKKTQ